MSFPGRLVETPTGRVFVHQGGQGPPLVLLHGMYCSHYYFKPVLEPLEQHFQVTTIDLPGFGESDRPPVDKYGYDAASAAGVVDHVMGAIGLPSAHVLGHSMGGGVAIHLASRHPARIQRLVIENGWIYPIVMPFLGRLALSPLFGAFLFKRLFARRDLVRHFRGVHRDPTIVTDEFVDYYWERFNRAGARDAGHAALKSFAALPDNTGEPDRIQAPTLIVWGEEDRLFPLALGKRLQKQIHGAELAVVPACGHSPHEERPDEFLRVVIPFLEAGNESGRSQAQGVTGD